jgi:mono/diheme cytochrome c family protein
LEKEMFAKKSVIVLGIAILILALAACGGGSSEGASAAATPRGQVEEATPVSMGDAAAGKEHYDSLCIACHGPTGEGIEGLGKPFTTSEFVRERSDEELLAFVKTGRPSGDPLNTTGVDMPPKGGNPALTDDDILDIVAYVRTLQK